MTSASTIVHSRESGSDSGCACGCAAGAFRISAGPAVLFPERLRNRLRVRIDEEAVVLAWDGTSPMIPRGVMVRRAGLTA
jgi:hypothetical protein